MDLMQRYYPESRFGGFTDIDGTIVFYNRIHALTPSSATVLDIGCGRGEFDDRPDCLNSQIRILRGRVAMVIGIDVDPSAESNPYIDQFHRLDSAEWPVASGSVDTAICDWVVEHVQDPLAFFAECHRVLAPGGYLCIRTTNRRGYVGLASRLIGNRHHRKVLAKVQEGRKEEDVFPTVYRCNTIPAIRRLLGGCGFEHCVYGYEPEPAYLGFNRLAYAWGVAYQRFAPKSFRNVLLAYARKRLQE